MKKFLKISAITLASLIAVIAIAFPILCFNIFSPSKLTKIVNNNANKFITSDFKIERAELTFFKSFPKVGIDLQNTTLKDINSDTLLYAKSLIAAIDIREYFRNNKVVINNFSLNDGCANIVINKEGVANYNIFKTDNKNDTSTFNSYIDLKKIKAKNLDFIFENQQSNILIELKETDLSLTGNFFENNIEGDLSVETTESFFSSKDSTNIIFSCDKTKLNYSGKFRDFNILNGNLDAYFADSHLSVDTNLYINSLDFALKSNIDFDFKKWGLGFDNGKIKLGNCILNIDGIIEQNSDNSSLNFDLDYKTEKWKICEVLPNIPQSLIGNSLKTVDLNGYISLQGNVLGEYNNKTFPIITTDVTIQNADLKINDFPLSFQNLDAVLNLNMNLNQQSDLTIKTFSATTKKRNKIIASGKIKDLFGKMLFSIIANGNLHIKDFSEFMPSDFTKCDGLANIDINTNFAYDSKKGFSLNDIIGEADCKFSDINILYQDTTTITSPLLTAKLKFPTDEKPYKIEEWLNAEIYSNQLQIKNLTDFNTVISDLKLNVYTNNFLDSTQELKLGTTYHIANLNLNIDTIFATLSNPNGKFVMYNSTDFLADYQGESAKFKLGNSFNFASDALNLRAKASYKHDEENPLLKWTPTVNLYVKNADAKLKNVEHHLQSSLLNIEFNPKTCELKNINFRFGESDVNLNGTITGIDSYLKDIGLLKGTLSLTANYLNINEILDIIDGFGAPDSLIAEANAIATNKKDSPFIVPFGVDLNMKTTIKEALVEDVTFRNIAGQIYIKDGILVLEEMGLTNDAAKMQLTAMYKTPRLNHLFLGFDFHLLDIKIDKLIEMIPDVDTILPMLKSFSGNAEFHFAAETYLKSNYDIKFSTLRGAAAINGKDLVVLDNETYKNISKKLLFNKKTQNKIDSLSTEITIFKNEVDVYPFLISIDKYSAVISGRHNLDMTYDYNISLIKPIRIGLDIIGLSDRLKYKVGKAKYANDFKPEKKRVVESNILKLKSLISNSLRENVKSFD